MRLHKKLFFIFITTLQLFSAEFDSVPSTKSDTGFFAAQNSLPFVLLGLASYTALSETNATVFGKTSWKALDAGIMAGLSSEILKPVFGRKRPYENNNPDNWFKNGDSFPSGHSAITAAVVTPYILEYGEQYPLVYLSALLPVYEAIGRVKARQHWPSDTIGGVLLGSLCGYIATQQDKPFIIQLIPYGDGIYAGASFKF